MVTWIVLAIAVLLGLCAEWVHARRCRRVAYLAFGPTGGPRSWAHWAPAVRVVALGLTAWGLAELWQLAGRSQTHENPRKGLYHLVLGLDVSPSMQITDAGPRGNLRRAERAAEVVRRVLGSIDLRRTRLTVLAFYSDSRPVVVDAADPEIVVNILNDLPLEHLFTVGKTNLYSVIDGANSVAPPWVGGSATLLIASDGDTLPPGTIPTLAPAYKELVILGFGDQQRGTFIDGHSSTQDATSLRQLATRLGGKYWDANARAVPSSALSWITAASSADPANQMNRRDWAVLSLLFGSFALSTLGPVLALGGTSWNPLAAARLTRPQPLRGV